MPLLIVFASLLWYLPVTSLVSRPSARQSVRHYWTEPGEYTLTASIYLLVGLDWIVDVKIRDEYMTLKTQAVKVKVEK